jgi:tetratricopeptide (TPR) repeat protein
MKFLKVIFGLILGIICLWSCKHDKVTVAPKTPKMAEEYFVRASAYLENQMIDSAFFDIFAALKLDTTKAKYYVLLSDLYFSQRETDLTEEMLEKAIVKDPKYNEAYLKLAELYFFLRMYPEANAKLDQALSLTAYNPKAHLIRSYILKDQGNISEAKRMLQLCIDQNPKEIKAFLELGYLYQMENNPIGIRFYQNVLDIDPYHFEANHNMALFYQDHGEYDKAMNQYKIILQADPTNKYALHNMGWIYMEGEGKHEEAVVFFTKALESDSTFVQAVCNRGVAFENLKQYDNARQDFQYACKLEENFEPALRGLNRLDKLKNR